MKTATTPAISDPDGLDLETPNVARIQDYVLGGCHNFGADRAAARTALNRQPDLQDQVHATRAFRGRAVRYLARLGIRQFLDLGCGIPNVGTVHGTAWSIAPTTRIAYIDNDPIAVAHTRGVLHGNGRTGVAEADIRDLPRLLNHPHLGTTLNSHQPIGILLVSVLDHITDADDPARIVGNLRNSVAPGSFFVIAHTATSDNRIADLWAQTSTPLVPRDRPHIEALFTGLDLIDPGVVWASLWRPDDGDVPARPESSGTLVGIGRT